jgi:hypothetical protein
VFLTLRKPTPNLFVSQWSTLPKLFRAPLSICGCRSCRDSVALGPEPVAGRYRRAGPRLLNEARSYGLNNGIKASRYRHTRNSSRAVNTSAGGKPSGAISA